MTFPSPSRATPLEVTNGIVERINRGKINASIDVTLTANAASTTITDARLASTSALLFDALTANAAAELAAGTIYVLAANRTNGSAIITHANNAQADRTFRVLIIG